MSRQSGKISTASCQNAESPTGNKISANTVLKTTSDTNNYFHLRCVEEFLDFGSISGLVSTLN